MRFMNDPSIWIKELFIQAGLSYSLSSFLSTVALVVIVTVLSWIANFIGKTYYKYCCHKDCKKDSFHSGMIFSLSRKFSRACHILLLRW